MLRELPYLPIPHEPHQEQWRNEVFHLNGGQLFTDEEIAKADQRLIELNGQAVEDFKHEGLIRYPVFHRTVTGELVEKEAWVHPDFEPSCADGFFDRHRMTTNIYVPSHGRAGTAQTPAMLDAFGVDNYYLLIDPSSYREYREHYPARRLVIRDITFREPAMLHPHSPIKRPMAMAGHAPLCNFALAFSCSMGEDYFTFSDDDIKNLDLVTRKRHASSVAVEGRGERVRDNFYRAYKLGAKHGFSFQNYWHRLEVLASRIRNPGFVGAEMAGIAFATPIEVKKGTRVYSFYITKNSTQVAHSGVQNNDVITSIELSKHGLLNMLVEGFCYNSAPTQQGGGQTEVYQTFGTLDKSTVLVNAEPNVASIVYRHSRIHHNCTFTPYTSLRPVGAVKKERP